MPTPINQLQDSCSPIDKFKIISKFAKFIPNSSSHSPKSVRLTQTPHIPFGSSPRPRRRTASPASRTRASAPAGSATAQSFQEHPRRILRPMLLESGSRPLADKNKTAVQRVLWCPCSSPEHRNAQYAGYSSHLLLVSQHTIFQFNEFPIKDPLQHLPAWYSLQSSDLRRFHYAESGLVMILIKRNE